jgi:hypothetical protein
MYFSDLRRSFWTECIRLGRKKAWGLESTALELVHLAGARSFSIQQGTSAGASTGSPQNTEKTSAVDVMGAHKDEFSLVMQQPTYVPHLSRLVFISLQIHFSLLRPSFGIIYNTSMLLFYAHHGYSTRSTRSACGTPLASDDFSRGSWRCQ